MSPKRKSLAKAHALFYKGFKTVDGDESTISAVYGKNIQISFFVVGVMAAKFSPEGDDRAGEGWNIKSEVIFAICTEFTEALFEVVVNSSWGKRHIFRLNSDRQVDTVFFQHKENCWSLLTRARSLPPSSPFKRPSPGMCPTWNCLDMCVQTANLKSQRCWFLNSFAKLRDHGILKRDVQRFSSESLSWLQSMLQTQVKVWRCTRSVSAASLKYYKKDVWVESKTSTLQVISMWNWDWCVQMKRTWTNEEETGVMDMNLKENEDELSFASVRVISLDRISLDRVRLWKCFARGLRHSFGRWRHVNSSGKTSKK